MFDYIKLFLKGIVLGVSNVIPGVSGGTMAVVFNVYDRIIALISPNIRRILREWKFWLPLGIGMGAGILAFSRIITKLLEIFPNPTSFFFIGLILGSVPLILRKIKSSVSDSENHKKSAGFFASLCVCFLIGLFAVLSMLLFGDASSAKEIAKESATLSASLTPAKAISFALAGAAAAVAMIIPGISGSFLLLAMGLYGEIMKAVSVLNVPILIPFAFGVLAGVIGGAALVRVLMKKIPAQTYSAILGLVAGSVALIFPGVAPFPVMIFSILALTLGFFAAYFSSRGE